MTDCEQKARDKLRAKEPNSKQTDRRAVAREMCRLLDSGILEEDLEGQPNDIEYLISRLEIPDGEHDPSLKQQWNSWVGQMDFINDNDYDSYQI